MITAGSLAAAAAAAVAFGQLTAGVVRAGLVAARVAAVTKMAMRMEEKGRSARHGAGSCLFLFLARSRSLPALPAAVATVSVAAAEAAVEAAVEEAVEADAAVTRGGRGLAPAAACGGAQGALVSLVSALES